MRGEEATLSFVRKDAARRRARHLKLEEAWELLDEALERRPSSEGLDLASPTRPTCNRCRPPCSLRFERKWLSDVHYFEPTAGDHVCGSTVLSHDVGEVKPLMLGAGRLALRVLLRASALRLFSRCVVKTCLVSWRSGSPPRYHPNPVAASTRCAHALPLAREDGSCGPSALVLPPASNLPTGACRADRLRLRGARPQVVLDRCPR